MPAWSPALLHACLSVRSPLSGSELRKSWNLLSISQVVSLSKLCATPAPFSTLRCQEGEIGKTVIITSFKTGAKFCQDKPGKSIVNWMQLRDSYMWFSNVRYTKGVHMPLAWPSLENFPQLIKCKVKKINGSSLASVFVLKTQELICQVIPWKPALFICTISYLTILRIATLFCLSSAGVILSWDILQL